MVTVVDATFNSAALSTMMGAARSTVPHQHAGSGGSLEDIVNTLNTKSAAFFVVPGADVMGNTLGLRSCHVIQVTWMILWWPEVGFASDKDDRNDGPADGPHLFYPLDCHVFQRIRRVNCEGDQNDVGLGI